MSDCITPIHNISIAGGQLIYSQAGKPDTYIPLPSTTGGNPVTFVRNGDGSITLSNGVDPDVLIPNYIASSPAISDLITQIKNSGTLITLQDAFSTNMFKAFPL